MIDDEFIDFLRELTEPLGGITMRKMFGGVSIYSDGVIFALVADGTLYLKADAVFTPAFGAEDCGPFTYADKQGRMATMPYWRLPDRLYDEPEEFLDWCRRSLDAARRMTAADAAGPARRRRAKGV